MGLKVEGIGFRAEVQGLGVRVTVERHTRSLSI